MYKLLKEKGNNLNVILENTETKAQLNLGRITLDVLSILEKEEDLTFGEKGKQMELDKFYGIINQKEKNEDE